MNKSLWCIVVSTFFATEMSYAETSSELPLDYIPFNAPNLPHEDPKPQSNTLPFFSYLNSNLGHGDGFYYGTQVAYSPYYTSVESSFNEHGHLHEEGDVVDISGLQLSRESNDTVAGRLYMGYRIDKYLSIENRFSKYPSGESINSVMTGTEIEYGDTPNKPHRHTEELIAKADLPVSDKLDLYLKGGPSYVYADYYNLNYTNDPNTGVTTPAYEEDTSRTVKHLYGVGSTFKFSNDFSGEISRVLILGFQYQNYSMTSIGLTYTAE